MTKKASLPNFLTVEERAALLRIPNRRYPTGLRNLAMLRLMLDAGLRAGEVLNLHLNDIDLNTGKLMVREGKGKKDRALWLSETVLDLLCQWRERRPTRGDLFFTTLKGQPVSSRYLRSMVAHCAMKAGITKRVHPHLLRHTFATQFFNETKNILMTQKALGHADVSTTMIYTHVVDAEMEMAMKKFSNR